MRAYKVRTGSVVRHLYHFSNVLDLVISRRPFITGAPGDTAIVLRYNGDLHLIYIDGVAVEITPERVLTS